MKNVAAKKDVVYIIVNGVRMSVQDYQNLDKSWILHSKFSSNIIAGEFFVDLFFGCTLRLHYVSLSMTDSSLSTLYSELSILNSLFWTLYSELSILNSLLTFP